ncbi:MAG: hypothetical protein HYT03_00870 [Candidatus Harrisonbacteria bacterium]|nr:hypothetical protein [Candidatus Harrisonbacteria bacterium]
MIFWKRKKNILILGAAGGVANAFLRLLLKRRGLIGKLVLLDRSARLPENPAYTLIHQEIKLPGQEKRYCDILKRYKIDLAIDLTDLDSLPLLKLTDQCGVSYFNTAMNGIGITTDELLDYVFKNREKINRGSHILCAGMNPGNVNLWVEHGVAQFGIPERIIHFEFDDSMTPNAWRPLVTWSRAKFLDEAVYEPGGKVLGRDKVEFIKPNALKNMVDMRSLLSPVINLEKYPSGFPILHEENITVGHRLDIPSEFIYAIHPQTIAFMKEKYDEQGTIKVEDLIAGDNVKVPLEGKDFIGVLLRYPDKNVYYHNAIANRDISGTNATYQQVAIGVLVGLLAWLDGLKRGVYFTGDLYKSSAPKYLFDNMVVEEKVFAKNSGVLKLLSHNPRIKLN